MKTTIIIPTWNNFLYLRQAVESLRKYTPEKDYRLVVIDNASFDETADYLRRNSIETYRNEHNEGFVKGINAGMKTVRNGDHVLLLNDDVQIVDPDWLRKLVSNLEDPAVGAVGPISNFVMGLQTIMLPQSVDLPIVHDSNLLVFFCVLISGNAFRDVGLMDERFGLGGNDDLDYSIRLRDRGYRLVVDRRVFVWHYGAKSIKRIGGYEEVEKNTRKILVDKWGQSKVDWLLKLPDDILALEGTCW